MSNIISKSVNSVVRLPIMSILDNYSKLLRRKLLFLILRWIRFYPTTIISKNYTYKYYILK